MSFIVATRNARVQCGDTYEKAVEIAQQEFGATIIGKRGFDYNQEVTVCWVFRDGRTGPVCRIEEVTLPVPDPLLKSGAAREASRAALREA